MIGTSPPLKPRLRLRRRRRARFKGPSFNWMVPNILTMLGLCAGLTALRFGLESRFDTAVVAILIAACIDGLDGRLARLLKATSRFGAEFDSLSDFLCFGVAPGFILYRWSLEQLGAIGFVPCVMYTVCMALRLARFNAAIDNTPSPAYAYNFFTGVPAPAGAILVFFPLFLGLEAARANWPHVAVLAHAPVFCGLVLVAVAGLSVSTLPIWSFKNFKVPVQMVLPMLLAIGGFATFLAADPWAALALGALLYAGMLPFSRRSYHRLRRDAEELFDEPAVADPAVAHHESVTEY